MDAYITRIATENGTGIEPDLLSGEFKDYVEDISCVICLCIVVDPVCCNKCSALFCKNCIHEWLKRNNTCTNRCEFQEQQLNKLTYKLLSKIKLKCSNKECNTIVDYENYYRHLNECDYSIFRCNGCGMTNNKRVISMHVGLCDRIIEACNFCGNLFKRQELELHYKQCPEARLQCEFCDKEVKRENLNKHLEACEDRLITCKYCETKYLFKKEFEHTKDVCFNDFKQRLKQSMNVNNYNTNYYNNNRSNNSNDDNQEKQNLLKEIERMKINEKLHLAEKERMMKLLNTLENENLVLKTRLNNSGNNNNNSIGGFFENLMGNPPKKNNSNPFFNGKHK